jgi:ketosteroid isomerase-like protein
MRIISQRLVLSEFPKDLLMKVLRAVLVPVVLLAAACSGPAAQEFTTTDAGAIRQQSDGLAAAFNATDTGKILALYAENSVFMPPNQPIIRGKDALKNFYDDLFQKQGATNLRLDIAEVSGYGPLAYQSGTYEMDLKPPSGPPGRDRGKYLFVLRKMANAWKYEYTMWNSDLPPVK